MARAFARRIHCRSRRNGRRGARKSAAGDLSILRRPNRTRARHARRRRRFSRSCARTRYKGTFCDPAYGGNANFVGWDLIGYPGVRLNVTAADQRMAAPAKPIRRSAYDYAMFANTWERLMPTNLKPTDVVIVGMGAAGGVAALPLAQAGLKVIGLEAGTWLTLERFRARRAAEQLPRVAAVGAEGEPRGADAPPQRLRAVFAAPAVSSDDERRRRHVAALLGAELAAEPMGLQGRQRDDETLRRLAHSRRIDGGRLAVRHRRDRALLRHRRARARRVRQGRQHRRKDRSTRKHFRGAAAPRVPDAAAAMERLAREDGRGRAHARLESVSRASGHQHADL